MLHASIHGYRHRRHHLVLAPLEPAQHLGRLRGVGGLAEQAPAQHHRRLGRQHRRAVLARRHHTGLVPRQPRHVRLGLLPGQQRLVHVGRDRAERQPQHLEQLAAARGAAGEDNNPAREGGGHRSRISVTGPSFTSSTSIMAPNSPVSTRVPLPAPRSLSSATNRSYKGIATSGGAASMKLGRRPLLASPYSVNCDTTSTAPPTSASARFIFPSASPNSRSPRILSAIQARRSSVSVGAKPARTKNPTPIDPVTRPSTRTAARETRWSTTLTPPRPPPPLRSAGSATPTCRAEVEPRHSPRGSTLAPPLPRSPS